jgi:ABC-type anion transport system duplicated permease subunit
MNAARIISMSNMRVRKKNILNSNTDVTDSHTLRILLPAPFCYFLTNIHTSLNGKYIVSAIAHTV